MNTNIIKTDTLPEFHGNFESWLETFFQFSCLVQQNFDETLNTEVFTQVKQTQANHGHSGLYNLVNTLTAEFQNKYPDPVIWDDYDYYDTLVEFFTDKNIL